MTDEKNSRFDGRNIVFVVGCPRSGTTWLQRLLASHPQIRTGQESNIFAEYLGPLIKNWRAGLSAERRGGIGLCCYFTEGEFREILADLMQTLLQPMVGSLQEGQLFLEKSPSHALFISEIVEMLPRSRFIHVVRDGRDVVASLLSASQSWGSVWAPRSPGAAAWLWARHVTAVREASKTLASGQFLEVRYEELHHSPRETLTRCARFLDLEWSDEAILAAVQANAAEVARASGGGTAIPLGGELARQGSRVVQEPQGFIRRAKVGNWQTDLSLWDKYCVWRRARKELADVGYRWPHFLASR